MSKNSSVVLTQKWSPPPLVCLVEKKEETVYGLPDDVLLVKHYPCTQPFYLFMTDGASGSLECSYRSSVAS